MNHANDSAMDKKNVALKNKTSLERNSSRYNLYVILHIAALIDGCGAFNQLRDEKDGEDRVFAGIAHLR